jgi:tRNA A37 threonylcarbamoyladenosine dehydratase
MPTALTQALTEDYLARFGGIGRLYGREALPRLHAAHVCVVGIGGVGSWAAEALARSGIGAITLIDPDDVCITNTNRQLPATADAIGRPKTDVLRERLAAINPECQITTATEFFSPSTARRLLAPKFDFLVDAIDRMSNKSLLIASCKEAGIPLVVVGGAGGRRDPAAIKIADLGESGGDELLKLVRRTLRADYGWATGKQHYGIPCVFSPEKPIYSWSNGTVCATQEPGSSLKMDCASGFGTTTFMTGTFGFLAAGEVVRRIALGA